MGERIVYALTKREAEVVQIIQDLEDRGVGPSLDEIAARMGSGKSSAYRTVDQLQHKGWLTRLPQTARSIRLLERLPERPGRDFVREIVELAAKAARGADYWRQELLVPLSPDLIRGACAQLGMPAEAENVA